MFLHYCGWVWCQQQWAVGIHVWAGIAKIPLRTEIKQKLKKNSSEAWNCYLVNPALSRFQSEYNAKHSSDLSSKKTKRLQKQRCDIFRRNFRNKAEDGFVFTFHSFLTYFFTISIFACILLMLVPLLHALPSSASSSPFWNPSRNCPCICTIRPLHPATGFRSSHDDCGLGWNAHLEKVRWSIELAGAWRWSHLQLWRVWKIISWKWWAHFNRNHLLENVI